MLGATHTTTTTLPARRLTPALAVAVILALMTVAAAACGGDGAATATTVVTSVPGTTAAPVTEPATVPTPVTSAPVTIQPTTPPTTAPTTPPATAPFDDGAAGFVPACTERPLAGGAAASPTDPDGLDAFGPIGVAPDLVLELPHHRDIADEQPGQVAAAIARIPGGLLVRVSQDSYGGGEPAFMLAAVALDGTVLWRRCSSGTYVGRPIVLSGATRPPFALLWSYDDAGARSALAFDVATGRDVEVPALDVIGGREEVAQLGDHVLFSGTAGDRVDLATDRMVLLDLATGVSSEVPYPERAGGQEPFRLIWRLVERSDRSLPVILQYDPFGTAVGAYVDGAWTTDPSAIVAIAPIDVGETYPDEATAPGVEARDGSGQRVWFHPTEGSLPGEGFHTAVVGDTVLANVCRERGDDPGLGCARGAFVGLDLATGALRWELPGFRQVGAADGSVAIIGAEPPSGGAAPPFAMIDVTSGTPIDGQEWPPDAFVNACCGDGEFYYVGQDGGLVWAVVDDHIDVYLPQGLASSAGRTVDLSA